MEKERFVNWEVLKLHLPAFICPPPETEEKLDKIVDLVEEELILRKAEAIKVKRSMAGRSEV